MKPTIARPKLKTHVAIDLEQTRAELSAADEREAAFEEREVKLCEALNLYAAFVRDVKDVAQCNYPNPSKLIEGMCDALDVRLTALRVADQDLGKPAPPLAQPTNAPVKNKGGAPRLLTDEQRRANRLASKARWNQKQRDKKAAEKAAPSKADADAIIETPKPKAEAGGVVITGNYDQRPGTSYADKVRSSPF